MWLSPNKKRVVAVIGYPGHGKTVFLAGMFWDSFFTLSQTWHDEQYPYSVHTLTEEASKVFISNGMILNRGELPPPNPRTMPNPATLEFKGVPAANGRARRRDIQLTFYDMAGELFQSDAALRQNAPFLPNTDDLIFLFDPTRGDFYESVFQASELLDRMRRMVSKLKRKHVIVALSKMDELYAPHQPQTAVTPYGADGCAPSPSDLPAYLQQMEQLSRPDVLYSRHTPPAGPAPAHLWQSDDAPHTPAPQAQNFINGLPRNTHYCALSALGHAPVWDCPNEECHIVKAKNKTVRTFHATSLRTCPKCSTARGSAPLRLSDKPQPFRVRDPLFWIFREAGVM